MRIRATCILGTDTTQKPVTTQVTELLAVSLRSLALNLNETEDLTSRIDKNLVATLTLKIRQLGDELLLSLVSNFSASISLFK